MKSRPAHHVGAVLGALLIYLVLAQPNHPDALAASVLLQFPLEWPVIVGILALLPRGRSWAHGIRAVIVFTLTLLSVLKLADFASFVAFNRAFNPLLDLHLADAAFRLAVGSVGWPTATLLSAGVAMLPFVLIAVLWWATGQVMGLDLPALARSGTALAGLSALTLLVAQIGAQRQTWSLPYPVPGTTYSTSLALDRVANFSRLYADLAVLESEASTDPFVGATNLFDRLDGRDVFVIFIESYGQTAYRNPLYAPTHLLTLERAEAKLAAAGLAMRSAWLTSPVSGGQSWLAHSTFASGLQIDNQSRYRAVLASSRPSLYHLAQAAGYETATLMPAITLPWPEARLMGFSRIYEAADLGYRGDAFNWTTMPDQYTLSKAAELLPDDPTPRFAMTALLSSHAPWTPVPRLLDWGQVGDGSIFDESQHSGPPGGAVWTNPDVMREQYRVALEYSLETVFDFAARNSYRDWLLVILGDHPPAGTVSQIEGQDVAIHLVGSSTALTAFDNWGFSDGLVPTKEAPVWPMSGFRDRFIRALSSAYAEEPA